MSQAISGLPVAGRRPVGNDRVLVEVRLRHPQAKLPRRGKPTDAGYDIYAVQDVVVPAGKTAEVPTGIQLSVPAGFYYTIEGRSSLNRARLVPYRAIIDATYTGDLTVYLQNFSDRDYVVLGPEPGRDGDRVAQLVLHRVLDMEFNQVQEFSSEYNKRGNDGWGSTGR